MRTGFKSNSWQPSKIETKHAKWVQTQHRGRRFESHKIEDDRFAKIALFHDRNHERQMKEEYSFKKTLSLDQRFVSLSVSAIALIAITTLK